MSINTEDITRPLMEEMAESPQRKTDEERRASTLDRQNPALNSCVAGCSRDGETDSVKSKTARAMHSTVSTMYQTLKQIDSDTTLNSDAKKLMSQDILDKTIAEFDNTLAHSREEMTRTLDAVDKDLFTNNSSLSPVDIALMANPKFMDNILADPYKAMDNVANASILDHLKTRGLLSDTFSYSDTFNDGLNRRHSPDAFNAAKKLQKDMESLSNIVQEQRYSFSKLQHNPETIQKIRQNKYKR